MVRRGLRRYGNGGSALAPWPSRRLEEAMTSSCLRICFDFPPLGFKGNLSLLEIYIYIYFSRGLNQMEDGQGAWTEKKELGRTHSMSSWALEQSGFLGR